MYTGPLDQAIKALQREGLLKPEYLGNTLSSPLAARQVPRGMTRVYKFNDILEATLKVREVLDRDRLPGGLQHAVFATCGKYDTHHSSPCRSSA